MKMFVTDLSINTFSTILEMIRTYGKAVRIAYSQHNIPQITTAILCVWNAWRVNIRLHGEVPVWWFPSSHCAVVAVLALAISTTFRPLCVGLQKLA